jgi:hypothetical protein
MRDLRLTTTIFLDAKKAISYQLSISIASGHRVHAMRERHIWKTKERKLGVFPLVVFGAV